MDHHANGNPMAGATWMWARVLFLLAMLGLTGWAMWQRPIDRRSIEATSTQWRVDLNTADRDTLTLLPGIGPTLAKRIIEHRQTQGRFSSPDDLDFVPGIGPTILKGVKPWVTCQPTQDMQNADQPKVDPAGD